MDRAALKDEDLPEEVLKAEQAIAAMTDTFLDWMNESLDQMATHLERAKAAPGENAHEIRRLFTLAHDMKGQGGAFGYDLVTALGALLCDFIRESSQGANSDQIQVVEAHVQAITFVVSRAVTGDGGPLGAQLLEKLQEVAARVQKPA